MGGHIYLLCIAKAKGAIRPTHSLESDISFVESTVRDDAPESFQHEVMTELTGESVAVVLEPEVLFDVDPPFDWADKGVAVLSFDYARHLSIPHKAQEKTNEFFACTLGYNVYMFGMVDECTGVQHCILRGEENNLKGSHITLSIWLQKTFATVLTLYCLPTTVLVKTKTRSCAHFFECLSKADSFQTFRK